MSSGTFFYQDDMPSDFMSPCLLWAVVDLSQYPVWKDEVPNRDSLPGYTNSKVISLIDCNIKEIQPTAYMITRDGKNSMYDYYWTGSNVPCVLSVVGQTIRDPEVTESTFSGVATAVLMNIPATNEIGQMTGSIYRQLSGVSNSAVNWTPETAILSATDENDFKVGGYLRGSFISANTGIDVKIQAGNVVLWEKNPSYYPFLWASNPENNTIHKIRAPYIRREWMNLDFPWLIDMRQDIIDTTYMEITAPQCAMSLTGFHGINCISVDEYKNVWCVDMETDIIYKLNPDGDNIFTVKFDDTSSITLLSGGCTPTTVSFDDLSGAWVSFFDAHAIARIDMNTGDVTNVIDLSGTQPDYDDADFKPISVETDINNDIWVACHHNAHSQIQKFDHTTLEKVSSILLPDNSNPVEIQFDPTGGIWVTLSHHAGPPYGSSFVQKYDTTTGNLLCSISANNPEFLAIDSRCNVWFSQLDNTITRVTSAGIMTSWNIGASGSTNIYSTPPGNIENDSSIGGLVCDMYDRIYVLNSVDHYLYSIIDDTIYNGLVVFPNTKTRWYNETGSIYPEHLSNDRSARAFGDWSGARWMRKYDYTTVQLLTADIYGESSPFQLYDFTGQISADSTKARIWQQQLKALLDPHT